MNKVSFIRLPDGTEKLCYGEAKIVKKEISDDVLEEIINMELEDVKILINKILNNDRIN